MQFPESLPSLDAVDVDPQGEGYGKVSSQRRALMRAGQPCFVPLEVSFVFDQLQQ